MTREGRTISVALDSIRGSIHRAKRPILGILADKKIENVPAQHIKELIEVLEFAENQLEVLSFNYSDTPGDGL